jgi:hypothetical protein
MITQLPKDCDKLLAEFIVKARARLLYLEEVDEIFARGAGRLPEEYIKYLRDLIDGNRDDLVTAISMAELCREQRNLVAEKLEPISGFRQLLDKVGIALPASPSPASGPKLSVVSDRGEAAGNDAGASPRGAGSETSEE